MIVSAKIQDVKKQTRSWKKQGLSVGLVTTMGYLHEGHASLIKKCREENDKVVVSVFVNPTQFGPNEDLAAYPRDFQRDSDLCKSLGVDLIFHPEPEEMYSNPKAYVNIEDLSAHLCGASRPIHFRGVCTVVTKLFNIVAPDRAYFGKKDAQQLLIIKKMVADLNMDVEVIGCPIIREADGLAKSSRNVYLDEAERKAALCLYRSVEKGKELIKQGVPVQDVLAQMKEIIIAEPLAEIDYLEAVETDTLQPVDAVTGKVLVAMAVRFPHGRLIDNFFFPEDE